VEHYGCQAERLDEFLFRLNHALQLKDDFGDEIDD
jgi:hypothetical protein